MSDPIAQLADVIREAASQRRPLRIRGGGTKDFYGGEPRGDVLDTKPLHGIISYEPTELVITARAGTPLAEVEAALQEKGQQLPFEPPHFDHQPEPAPSSAAGHGELAIATVAPEEKIATLGGCIATGLSGPRRAYADRKSTRLNSSHMSESRMPSSA